MRALQGKPVAPRSLVAQHSLVETGKIVVEDMPADRRGLASFVAERNRPEA